MIHALMAVCSLAGLGLGLWLACVYYDVLRHEWDKD